MCGQNISYTTHRKYIPIQPRIVKNQLHANYYDQYKIMNNQQLPTLQLLSQPINNAYKDLLN